jgi:putative endonuclease
MLPGDRGYYMYVLACSDHSLYAGYTVDLPRRLACHQAGKASKYTRTRLPVQVRAWWSFPTQRAAMQAEVAFKALSRAEKLRRLKSGFVPDGASAPSDLGITANG